MLLKACLVSYVMSLSPITLESQSYEIGVRLSLLDVKLSPFYVKLSSLDVKLSSLD
jgi:hypothetical protein